ncbi:phage tail tape measure protein, TP901 family [Syntrophobotulus glycolicus DSM 8271]|uniref:Phage tail tape measure protein, TP901 family n=1 Tax=Syntrophobotulus glycolicus (strain DSM 8271 / FlGlyR) TaxID=645991 RepID=F0T174_SYNGF|nr:phage tail tape measure protein [Syntrophobotulus glycolicus]ADY55138.1 phage tail tape measure protein, TP901 family [Syntrophobotulus glycolicus DSM 8271]
MASTTMQVALILTAVNNLGPNIKSAKNMIVGLGKTAAETQKRINDLQNLKASGVADIRSGAAMLVPLEEALRKAALFEDVMNDVGIANYDASIPLNMQKEQLEELSDLALKLGAETKFNNTDAANAQMELLKNGMAYQDVMEGGAKASMYLGQTAKAAPETAAEAVSQLTNMFQLNGNQLMQVADDINRAANASSAGVQAIMNDMQQTGGTAKLLGLTAKDTSLMLGTLHNMGLGDSSGNYLNDMLLNLNKATPKARKALEEMGLLKDATVTYTKSGTMKVSGGQNSVFNSQGQIKNAQSLVESLRASMIGVDLSSLYDTNGKMLPDDEIASMVESSNKLKALQNFKDVFGIQGMRAAIALAQTGKGSYEEMVGKAGNMKSIEEQVISQQSTLIGKLETLKGSAETLMTSSGTPMIEELKSYADTANQIVDTIQVWTTAHPEATKAIMKTVIALGGLRIGLGIGKLLTSQFGFMGIGIGNAASKVIGFASTYSYFRQGSGIFRSLWSAISFGSPVLTKAGSIVGGFGGKVLTAGSQALIAGGRMALAWVIGLGPVGWIVGGVTLAIIAAVAAWKTNFGGFQDWVIKWATKVVEIINKVRNFFGASSLEYDWMVQSSDGKNLQALNSPKTTPFLGDGSKTTDNRQFNFQIQSTDPKAAAGEVSSILGGKGMDKYQMSRDPRFSSDPVYP